MRYSLILIFHGLSVLAIQNNTFHDYACETNFNCSIVLTNSLCLNGKCVCQFGYGSDGCLVQENLPRYRRQIIKGLRMLNEPCEWSTQCRRMLTDEGKVCLARKCQCSPGYVPIDAYRCVKDMMMLPTTVRLSKSYQNELLGFGSACLTTMQCQQTSMHLECVHGMCICIKGYVPLGKYLCYNIGTQVDPITVSTVSSTTAINKLVNNDALKPLGKIGNSCFNDYFCRRTVSESHCYNGRCACIEGYISIDQYTCMKDMNKDTTTKSSPIPFDYKSLLGGKCSTKRNCHTSNAICQNSICTCPIGYFPVDDWTCLEESESSDGDFVETTPPITTTEPIETTSKLLTTTVFRWWPWSPTTYPTITNMENVFRARCLLNRQCASMDPNSHCTLFGRCVCNLGYKLKTTKRGQFCVPRVKDDDNCD